MGPTAALLPGGSDGVRDPLDAVAPGGYGVPGSRSPDRVVILFSSLIGALTRCSIGRTGAGSTRTDDRTTLFRVKAGHIMFNIYVGNLSFEATEDELRGLFEEHGEVLKVNLITDRDTGRPRGFGFVEMADAAQGRTAIEQINGREVGGRTVTVNEAKPRESRSGGGGGGGGGRRDRW